MPRNPLQRRPTVAASLALAMASLYGAGSLSGLLHLASERHRVCLEHGELIEAGRGPVAPEAPRPSADRPAVAAAVAPEGHGHDHCAVADHLRQAGLSPAAAVRAPTPPPAGRAIACPSDRAHHPIAALALSPKHSPPATA